MRKVSFVLSLFITFAITAYLGYSAASHSTSANTGNPEVSPTNTPQASQQNLLMIQADRLDDTRSSLRTIWLASYFHSSNQTVLTFIQLFPTNESTEKSKINSAFALQSDGIPSKKFFRALSNTGIDWDGFLLVDDIGSAQVEKWLRDQGIPVFTSDSNSSSILPHLACSYLNGEAAMLDGSGIKFDWLAFDAHFQTDLPVDTLIGGWNSLFDTTRPLRCQVERE